MKNRFWRRFLILLLALTLPFSAVSMSLASPSSIEMGSGNFETSVTTILADARDELACPAPSYIEQTIQCADMAHNCTSCVTTLNLATVITPLATIAIVYLAHLDMASFVPPLLERPPALEEPFA